MTKVLSLFVVFSCFILKNNIFVLCGFLDYIDLDDAFFNIWNTQTRSDQDVSSDECSINGQDSTLNGVCTTKSDCKFQKGTSVYNSACGYLRTCCIASKSCDQKTNSKVSYFKYSDAQKNTKYCMFTVQLQEDVCQLRLDFLRFKMELADSTQKACVKEDLTVSDNLGELKLCGENTNQHVYLHVGGQNQVKFSIKSEGTADVNMKITQLKCTSPISTHKHKETNNDFRLLAPVGCRQYFTDVRGTIRSLSYDNDLNHFTPKNSYAVCIKRRQQDCKIHYTGVIGIDGSEKDEKKCPDFVFIPGQLPNPNPTPSKDIVAKVCENHLDASFDSRSPGLFYLYFSNGQTGNSKFNLDYEVKSCTGM